MSVCVEPSYIRGGRQMPCGAGESPRALKKVLEASPLAEKLPPNDKPSQEKGRWDQKSANCSTRAVGSAGQEASAARRARPPL